MTTRLLRSIRGNMDSWRNWLVNIGKKLRDISRCCLSRIEMIELMCLVFHWKITSLLAIKTIRTYSRRWGMKSPKRSKRSRNHNTIMTKRLTKVHLKQICILKIWGVMRFATNMIPEARTYLVIKTHQEDKVRESMLKWQVKETNWGSIYSILTHHTQDQVKL